MTKSSLYAVIDMGSNGFTLEIFKNHGDGAPPESLYKITHQCKLAEGMLQENPRLNEDGIACAKKALKAFKEKIEKRKLKPDHVFLVATDAIRRTQETETTKDLLEYAKATFPESSLDILTEEQEAKASRQALFCAFPDAKGLGFNTGGASSEFGLQDTEDAPQKWVTIRYGALTLLAAAEGNIPEAAKIFGAALDQYDWIPMAKGKPLYLMGGSFSALAKAINWLSKKEKKTKKALQEEGGKKKDKPKKAQEIDFPHGATLYPAHIQPYLKALAGFEVSDFNAAPEDIKKRAKMIPLMALVLQEIMNRVAPHRIVRCALGMRVGVLKIKLKDHTPGG